MKKILFLFLTILLFGLSAFYLLQLYVNQIGDKYLVSLQDAPKVQAVIILGAFVHQGGQPSAVLQARLDYGYNLYQAGKAAKIIVSGDHGTKNYDEVNAMRDYLVSKGVPAKDIFLDHAGFNTYDSMYRARDVFGVRSLLISTQQFHIQRSVYIARRLGIEAYGYPSPDKEIYSMKYLKGREGLAKVKAFFNVELIKPKPRFLGEPINLAGDGRVTAD